MIFIGGPLDGQDRSYDGNSTLMHVVGEPGLLGAYYIATVRVQPLARGWVWRAFTRKHRWLTGNTCQRCFITRYQLAKRKTLHWPTDCLTIAREKPRRELA